MSDLNQNIHDMNYYMCSQNLSFPDASVTLAKLATKITFLCKSSLDILWIKKIWDVKLLTPIKTFMK